MRGWNRFRETICRQANYIASIAVSQPTPQERGSDKWFQRLLRLANEVRVGGHAAAEPMMVSIMPGRRTASRSRALSAAKGPVTTHDGRSRSAIAIAGVAPMMSLPRCEPDPLTLCADCLGCTRIRL